jgi:Spy/CpxP family protein refolding chaperone
MKLNKTLLIATLVAGSFWAGNVTVNAQGTTNPPPAATAPRPLRTGLESLNLTADQKAKAEPIVKDMQHQLLTLHADKAVTPADKRIKFKEIRDAATAKLKDILTPEQFAIWQKQNGGLGARPKLPPPTAPTGETKPATSEK